LFRSEAASGQDAATPPSGAAGDIHRIGGGDIENLRLKPAEAKLNPPGISVLKGGSPYAAAGQMKAAFPNATKLHETANIVGSATEEAIRRAGFDVMPDPSRKFPNHHRLVHTEGIAGFVDANLARLSGVFTDTVLGE
jgi:hypothetical protein